MWLFCLHVYLSTASARGSEEGVRPPGAGATDSCELPCELWESSPGHLEERTVVLTAEPSPQPPSVVDFIFRVKRVKGA